MFDKNKNRFRIIWFLSFLLFLAVATALGQDAGKKVFETKCFSCHSIGSGDKQGPDLKGVTDRRSEEWLGEFIRSPTAMSAKDADAAEIFKKFSPEVMPDQQLTDDELSSISELIKSMTASGEIFTPEGAKLSREIVAADVPDGWRLFTGQTKFDNGGVSCNSCHSINSFGSLGGGTLGPDLTAVNTKYRDPELISILQNPNFPTMTKMFQDRKLTDEEIVKVFAYLQNSKTVSPNAQVVPTATTGAVEPKFLVIGFIATILALVGFNFIWRRRHKGVREDIVQRSKI